MGRHAGGHMFTLLSSSAMAFTLLGLDFSEESEPIQPPFVIDVASFPDGFAAPGELEAALSFTLETVNSQSGAVLHLNDGGVATGAANELVVEYVDSIDDNAVGRAFASWSSDTGASCRIEIYGSNNGGTMDWYTGVSADGIEFGQSDLIGTMLHELGHCLGLGHSDDPTAVMYFVSDVGTTERELTPDDSAGLQAIYGVAFTELTASGFTVDDEDGDGVLGRNELATVTFTVENVGNVAATDVVAGTEGVFEGVTSDDVVLDTLAPNTPTEVSFDVVSDKSCDAKEASIELVITDANGERLVVGSIPVECKGGLGCSSSSVPASLGAFTLAALLFRRRSR